MKKIIFCIWLVLICNLNVYALDILLLPIEKNKKPIFEHSDIVDTIQVIAYISFKIDTTFFYQKYTQFEIYDFEFHRIRSKLEKIPNDEFLKKIICDELKKSYYLELAYGSTEEFRKAYKAYNRDIVSFYVKITIVPPKSSNNN